MKLNIYLFFLILVLLVSLIMYNTEGFTAAGMATTAKNISGSGGFDASIILIIVGSTFGVVILGAVIRYIFTKPSASNY